MLYVVGKYRDICTVWFDVSALFFFLLGGCGGGVVALRQHLYLVVKPSLGNRLLEVA